MRTTQFKNISLTSSPIFIPEQFHKVPYRAECYPGSTELTKLEEGANCQHFSYELIRYYGRIIPDLRSSDLWEDTQYTTKVIELESLDLVLLNRVNKSWGAHVGVYIGLGLIMHLSKSNGFPVIECLDSLMQKAEYNYFIGAKRGQVMQDATEL